MDWPAVENLCRRYALGDPEIDRLHQMLFAWYDAQRVYAAMLRALTVDIPFAPRMVAH